MARIKTNAKKVAKKIRKYARQLSNEILKDAMFVSLEEVGLTAAQDHMIPTTSRAASIEQLTVADKLTVRTGTLIGSIVSAFRFSDVDLPTSVHSLLNQDYKSNTEGFEGGKKLSIREVKVGAGKFEGIIGSEVEYAEMHENSARAFLKPAAQESMPTIMDIFEEAIESTFKRQRI